MYLYIITNDFTKKWLQIQAIKNTKYWAMNENKQKSLKTNSIGEPPTIGGKDLHCCRLVG
jgi:hypothetical protein